MTDQNFHLLIYQKLRDGQLPPNQAAALEAWLQAAPANRKAAADIEAIWKASDPGAVPLPEMDVAAELEALKHRLQQEKALKAQHGRRWWMAAAAALALGVAAVWFWSQNRSAAWQTATAQPLETLHIGLPDGSKIKLNQNSTLQYPTAFTAKERRVKLRGEALFEVSPNPEQPFVVETDGCETVVLGTTFNVRALPNEPLVEVALFSGRVRLQSPAAQVEIAPGNTAVFAKKDNTLTTNAYIAAATSAWHSGSLKFEHTPLAEVLSQLQRLFDQTFELENTQLAGCKYTAFFPKNDLSAIVANLETVFGLRPEKTANGYLLRGGHCGD
jgi:transmembrane sensor